MSVSKFSHGITVIIPTWKKVPYLDDAVRSVLDQSIPREQLELLIIVNGNDKEYYQQLEEKYENTQGVRVLFTELANLGHARNIGIQETSKEFLLFLDDDDWLTPNYLTELLAVTDNEVDIAAGKLYDYKQEKVNPHTYISKAIIKCGNARTKNYLSLFSIFGNMTGKLFRTSTMRETFSPIPEGVAHSEDILFWANNFGNLTGYLSTVTSSSKEAYCRRITSSSLSRPNKTQLNQYIEDKLEIIKRLSELALSNETKIDHKKFLMRQIRAQEKFVRRYCEEDEGGQRTHLVRKYLAEDKGFLMRRAPFAESKGIAFCQRFAPLSSPSAYVATRRLEQIADHVGTLIDWQVYQQNYPKLKTESDPLFDLMYAQVHYGNRKTVNVASAKNFTLWAQQAFEQAIFTKAPYIYSRAMQPGGHVAAYKYKELYPDTIWYAEFSDPIAVNTIDRPRAEKFWQIEQMAYDRADYLIFTNLGQREHMLSYCDRDDVDELRKRSLIWQQPLMHKEYLKAINTNYELDHNMINIAFFGSFYKKRNHAEMIKLLKNPRVILHVFTLFDHGKTYKNVEDDMLQMGLDQNRLKSNNAVSYIEMFSLASQMDYLYLDDIDFPGKINPYLPSKYTDYLASGSSIIAKIQSGSPLSKRDDPQLIKTTSLDDDFVMNIEK